MAAKGTVQYTVYFTSAKADGRSAIMADSVFLAADEHPTTESLQARLQLMHDDTSIQVRDWA